MRWHHENNQQNEQMKYVPYHLIAFIIIINRIRWVWTMISVGTSYTNYIIWNMVNLKIKLYYWFFRFENYYCCQVVKHMQAKKTVKIGLNLSFQTVVSDVLQGSVLGSLFLIHQWYIPFFSTSKIPSRW